MSECANCNVSVYVPDGYEFEEGDLCMSCLKHKSDRLQALVDSADDPDGSMMWTSDHEKIINRYKDCIRELLKGGEHKGECDNDQGMLNEGGACQKHCDANDAREDAARKLLEATDGR
jgi:uncharacterized protein YaaR (DUF327 family)